ncbi:hypothetical protein BDB00DRAFT_938929 [Zychaea mexicana]|uniref:uncharacterized protein n=1 Tax=Zychaea mexicana TaxID=64656 RepID=UPI0022FED2D4|nr:uncharacterized protein BDB00DRAFT_938929 [Zychaea mexicana]KAI9493594.1 hypothetical protein BDB00DRAFT_938929 [Zychaea mexicana]
MQDEIVYAIHDFVAENDDEIAFHAGDSIVVLEKDEKYMDGWWQGRNPQGHVGLFPMNYTTHVKPTPAPPPSSSTPALSPAHSSSGSNTLEDEIDNAITHVSTNLITPSTSTSASAAFMHQPQPPPAGSPPPPPSSSSSSSHPASVVAPPPITTIDTTTTAAAAPSPSSKTEDWSIDQVAEWLQCVGLENVSSNFVEQEITGDILLSLTIDSLKELGITAYGRRYKVMNAIEKLKNATGQGNDEQQQQQQQPKEQPEQQQKHQSEASTPSVPCSPIDSDSMYQFPRKAPMPPQGGSTSTELNHNSSSTTSSNNSSSHRRPTDSLLTAGQLSPRSYASSSVSRSNTFQTISSSKSSTSSSGRMPSQKSRDSIEKERAPSMENQQQQQQQQQQPMASIHELPSSPPIHPMDGGRTLSMAAADPFATRDRNMSVASVDPFALNRASTHVFKAPEHEGWLHKQGDKYRTWNKRWFVLKGSNLFYFKSPKEVRMKGIIHLRGYRIVPDESIHPGKYSFKAQHERERTFYFYTDSKESLRTWIKVLMKATITRDFASPVMSSNHVATVPLEVAQRLRPRPPSMLIHPHSSNSKAAAAAGATAAGHKSPPISPIERQDEWQSPPQLQHQLSASTSTDTKNSSSRLSPQHPPLSSQQSRESGITVYPTTLEPQHPHHYLTDSLADNVGDEPDVPDKYMYDHLNGPSPIAPAPTLSSSILMSDEDEDLIDPHHKAMVHSPPLQSPPLPPANLPPPPPPPAPSSSSGPSARDLTRVQYVDWINKHLPPGKRAIDLAGAFRNGDSLILLLESLSGKTVRRPPAQKGGSVSMMMLDNIVAAFKFMGREGVVVDGRYTIKDIFGGDEEKIMDMLDAIMDWREKMTDDAA